MRGGRGIEGRGLDGFPPRPRALTAETVDGCGRRSPAGTCAVQCRVWIRRQAAHGYAPFGCRTAGSGKHGGRAFMEPVSAMARIAGESGAGLAGIRGEGEPYGGASPQQRPSSISDTDRGRDREILWTFREWNPDQLSDGRRRIVFPPHRGMGKGRRTAGSGECAPSPSSAGPMYLRLGSGSSMRCGKVVRINPAYPGLSIADARACRSPDCQRFSLPDRSWIPSFRGGRLSERQYSPSSRIAAANWSKFTGLTT